MKIRKPNSLIWLTNKNILVEFIKNNISCLSEKNLSSNVSYLECPKIGVKLKTLADFIKSTLTEKNSVSILDLNSEIKLSGINSEKELTLHIKYLQESILEQYNNGIS